MSNKRFIFDLDGTLLSADYSFEKEFFFSYFGEEAFRISDNLSRYLDEYEKLYDYYDEELLGVFLSEKLKLHFSNQLIRDWMYELCSTTDELESGAIELIEYLKSKNYSLVILTNWFKVTQVERLKRSGLLDYFDEIYAGDICLKPRRESYELATSNYSYDDCVMIGDNLEKDYIGPRCCSIESILYDKNNVHDKSVVKVKRLSEIKNIY